MKVAIMQPYLFPYIGYFQLISAADKFVIYDDLTFIKQGWINRNNILLNGKSFLFTVPVKNASSNKPILETEVSNNFNWRSKLLRTIEQAYRKAPYYDSGIGLIKEVVCSEENLIAALALKSLKVVCAYTGIETIFVESSSKYRNKNLGSQARVMDICRRENAVEYLNPIGGLELYSKEDFSRENIELSFIKTKKLSYKQFDNEFIPRLSIIDVVMFNSPEKIRDMLTRYHLI